MKQFLVLSISALLVASLAGCGPKRGSDAWCKKMDEMPKGKWTLEDAGDYTKYCVLNQKPDQE